MMKHEISHSTVVVALPQQHVVAELIQDLLKVAEGR